MPEDMEMEVEEPEYEYERTGTTHLVHAWHARGHPVSVPRLLS